MVMLEVVAVSVYGDRNIYSTEVIEMATKEITVVRLAEPMNNIQSQPVTQ